MTDKIELTEIVPDELDGKRFDQIAAKLFPDFSRARLQSWIKSGDLTVSGQTHKVKDKLMGGVQLQLHAELVNDEVYEAQDIPLDIVYEDDTLLVVNKPAGLVVHPAAGNRDGTLLNGLLFHCEGLAAIPRAGIVHRIDKETTGLLVVAKTLKAHHSLVKQLQKKTVFREYEAIAGGVLTGGRTIEAPIARHPTQRTRMAVVENGKDAVTHFRVIERFRSHTHIKVQLETGRTHQIRVHLAHLRYPLLGDPLYSRLRLPKGASHDLVKALKEFPRQALHARTLGLIHPETKEEMEWTTDLPEDMQTMLDLLRADAEED